MRDRLKLENNYFALTHTRISKTLAECNDELHLDCLVERFLDEHIYLLRWFGFRIMETDDAVWAGSMILELAGPYRESRIANLLTFLARWRFAVTVEGDRLMVKPRPATPNPFFPVDDPDDLEYWSCWSALTNNGTTF